MTDLMQVKYVEPGAILLVLDDTCPRCRGALDSGYECNTCDYDAAPILKFHEECADRGERMTGQGLYRSEVGKLWPA